MNILQKNVETEFHRIVNRNSIYKVCRFAMRRGRNDAKKSIVYIICNGLNFEFGEIQLPQNSFNAINKHKEKINYREENIK